MALFSELHVLGSLPLGKKKEKEHVGSMFDSLRVSYGEHGGHLPLSGSDGRFSC